MTIRRKMQNSRRKRVPRRMTKLRVQAKAKIDLRVKVGGERLC